METIPKLTADIAYISKLGDYPNTDDNLTADGLKAKFDQAGLEIQKYLNEQAETINNNNDELQKAVSSNAISLSGLVKRFTAEVGIDWEGSGPYIQQIPVPGIKSTDMPIVDLVPSDDFSAAKNEIEAYAKIYRIRTSTDKIAVYATDVTSVGFTIKMEVNREPEEA